MLKTLIGTRIRESRLAKHISQTTLAKQVGISASYLNLIEHNRRGIGGKTLLALAEALDMDPRKLTEGVGQDLINHVKQAAAAFSSAPSETGRMEEFITRFPGFANLIVKQFDALSLHKDALHALSDQISNDPFFAEAMHLMLSHITAIRSTAEILTDKHVLPADQKQRFFSNLLQEAYRLSKTAQDILKHFEPGTNDAPVKNEPFFQETLLEQNNFYIDAIENGQCTSQDYIDQMHLSDFDRTQAVKSLERYETLCRLMPIPTFKKLAEHHKYDPIILSRVLDVPLMLVLKRLAHLPNQDNIPRFGMIECDGAGAILYRKPLPLLSLPRVGGTCSLWPIYRSLTQPLTPIKAFINTPTGERFLTYSLSDYMEQNAVGLPGRVHAVMIFTSDYEAFLPRHEFSVLPTLSIGLQCSVCPQEACEARRSDYVLH